MTLSIDEFGTGYPLKSAATHWEAVVKARREERLLRC